MTPRENLLTVFRHEMPAWIPVTGHVDPYNQPNRRGMDPKLAEELGTVGWGDGSTLKFSRYLGLDIMDFYGPPIRARYRKVTVESVRTEDGWVNTYKTPRGELREVHRRACDGHTSYCVEHLVKDKSDLPALASIFEDQEYEIDPAGVEQLKKRKAMIGDEGMIRCYMPGTPLGMMVRVYAGVQTTAFLWADARRELHELFRTMEENYVRFFRLAASLDYDILYGTDDTSTTAISPAMFEEFCLGYTDRIADTVHAQGKLYAHHSCGHIRDLLDLYRQTKMDAVDAVCIKPLGNVTIAETKAKLGPKITILATVVQLFGNMDERAAVAESIARMFEEAAPGDNIIFGIGADPEKDMAETKFVADECLKHRKLPMKSRST